LSLSPPVLLLSRLLLLLTRLVLNHLLVRSSTPTSP
jgi:hypothetical protein